ncbi:rhamnogalacturonan lyase, partial [Streptomyces scabiei]
MQHPQPYAQSHPPTRIPARTRHRTLLSAVSAGVLAAAGLVSLSATPAEAATARQVEALDRGVVSVHTDSGNLVS